MSEVHDLAIARPCPTRSPISMIARGTHDKRELEINGTPLTFETGKLAKQAHGSVIVRCGDSVVLVTACRAANPREGIDFLPLTVDYREYTYASGRIPGGFFKREGKPPEKEVLTSRVHRPADPAAVPRRLALRDADHRAGAVGRHRNDTDVLAITGASAALALSRFRSRRRSPASASAWSTASSSSTRPTSSARRASSTSSSPAARTAW